MLKRIVFKNENQVIKEFNNLLKEEKEVLLFFKDIRPYPLLSSFILKIFRFAKSKKVRLILIVPEYRHYLEFYRELKKFIEIFESEEEYLNNRIYTSFEIKLYLDNLYIRKLVKTLLTDNNFIVKERDLSNFIFKRQIPTENNIYIIDFDKYHDKIQEKIHEIKMISKKAVIILLIHNDDEDIPLLDVDYVITHPIDKEMFIKLIKRVSLENYFKLKNEHLLIKLQELNSQIEDELKLASEIQKSFLPQNKEIPHYDVSYYNKPSLRIGGDYFDVLSIDKNRIAFFFADISGHGIAAALLSNILRVCILMNKEKLKIGLDEFLSSLNESLVKIFPKQKFVSMYSLLIDTKNHNVIYSKSSQESAILVRDKKAHILDTNGTLLGIFSKEKFKNLSFEKKQIKLKKDDIILLYTDGITELEDSQGYYGLDRLLNLVTKNSNKPSNDIINDIVEDINKFSKIHQDDISLLIIKNKGS